MNEKADKPTEPTEPGNEHRLRMRFDWNNLIEDLIEEGRKKGAFDNLPGKGKPLNLNRNLFAPDTELANTLLKDNNLQPAWIMNRNHILTQKEQLRADIEKSWLQHAQALRFVQGEAQRSALIASWDDACSGWEKEIRALNKLIDNFNLKRPVDNLELFKLNIAEELERVGASRWLKGID